MSSNKLYFAELLIWIRLQKNFRDWHFFSFFARVSALKHPWGRCLRRAKYRHIRRQKKSKNIFWTVLFFFELVFDLKTEFLRENMKSWSKWKITKSMVKYGCHRVPYSCQMSTKTSEMNVSARDVFKKSKIIGIGSVEKFFEQFQIWNSNSDLPCQPHAG